MPTSSDKRTAIKIAKHRAKQPMDDMNEAQLRQVFDAHQLVFEHQNQTLNYAKSTLFKNVARYTPAMSEGYINSVTRLGSAETMAIANNDPDNNPFAQFGFGAEDLKFINPKSRLFFYPWVLFSGGQGARTKAAAANENWITQRPRDSRVVVLGDSGGYQIQEQTIPFDPIETPGRMLSWLERVADQSMVLDFPTGAITAGSMVPHVDMLISEGVDVFAQARSIGLSSSYTAALLRTCQNNEYFAQHRVSGATKMLNVIQGRNETESRYWYEQVRSFPFEGWAFAGGHSVQLSITLRRLIQMRDDGLLHPNSYMHFLGVSTLKVGVALTLIQRALRKYTDGKGIQITFDSKSPVDAMVNGYQAIAGYNFSPDKWSIRTERTNQLRYLGSDLMLRDLAQDWASKDPNRRKAQSTLAHILTLNDLVGPVSSKTGKRIPTSLQQVLLVHHNTQALIEAFRNAYRFLDAKSVLQRATPIRHLSEMIREVFIAENPDSVISSCERDLDALSYEGVFGK